MLSTAAQQRAALELAAIAYTDEVNPGTRVADITNALATAVPAGAGSPWTLAWGPGEVEGILAYVARSSDKSTYALAFRGSLSQLTAHEFVDNWLANINTFRQVPWLFPQGGAVQISSGMNGALAYVTMLTDRTTNKHLLDFLRGVVASEKSLNLLVTGHSLGGALTQLASQWLYNQLVQTGHLANVHITPMTFAAPTTGNQQFSALFQTTFPDNYACVNEHDIVPRAWWDFHALQSMYPRPGQTIAEFGVAAAAAVAIYKASTGNVYRPVTAPPMDMFPGWMPQAPDKFAHTMEVNHGIDTYRDYIRVKTNIY